MTAMLQNLHSWRHLSTMLRPEGGMVRSTVRQLTGGTEVLHAVGGIASEAERRSEESRLANAAVLAEVKECRRAVSELAATHNRVAAELADARGSIRELTEEVRALAAKK